MAKRKAVKTDEELLKHLTEKAPEVLEARIDFHEVVRRIVVAPVDQPVKPKK